MNDTPTILMQCLTCGHTQDFSPRFVTDGCADGQCDKCKCGRRWVSQRTIIFRMLVCFIFAVALSGCAPVETAHKQFHHATIVLTNSVLMPSTQKLTRTVVATTILTVTNTVTLDVPNIPGAGIDFLYVNVSTNNGASFFEVIIDDRGNCYYLSGDDSIAKVVRGPCGLGLRMQLIRQRGTQFFFYIARNELPMKDTNEDFAILRYPPESPVVTGYHLNGDGLVTHSSDLANWSAFTNLPTGGIDLPLAPGNHFLKGSNLKLTANMRPASTVFLPLDEDKKLKVPTSLLNYE